MYSSSFSLLAAVKVFEFGAYLTSLLERNSSVSVMVGASALVQFIPRSVHLTLDESVVHDRRVDCFMRLCMLEDILHIVDDYVVIW